MRLANYQRPRTYLGWVIANLLRRSREGYLKKTLGIKNTKR